MTEAKSVSNDVKRVAAEAQAAVVDFASTVNDDVKKLAKDVGRSSRKTGGALHDDVEVLSKEVERIVASLRKLAERASEEVIDGAHDKIEAWEADTGKFAAAAKRMTLSAVNQAEAAITANPLTSILLALGFGVALSHLMRR